MNFKPLEVQKLIKFLDEMEFNRIKSLVTNKFGSKNQPPSETEEQSNQQKDNEYFTPLREKVNRGIYELILNEKDLTKWIQKIIESGVVAIDCETTSLVLLKQKLLVFQCL